MAYVQLDRRFGKRKVGRKKFDFFGLRDFTGKEIQQAEQRAKVDVFAEHDPFYLEEIGCVSRIHLIVAKTTGDGKILSRHIRLSRQCAGRDSSPLAP
jgi:hypothetical protein